MEQRTHRGIRQAIRANEIVGQMRIEDWLAVSEEGRQSLSNDGGRVRRFTIGEVGMRERYNKSLKLTPQSTFVTVERGANRSGEETAAVQLNSMLDAIKVFRAECTADQLTLQPHA